jgi:hypothetical protein
MDDGRGRRAAVPRRRVLKAFALASAAVAGCAGAQAERGEAAADGAPVPKRGGDVAGAPGSAVAAVRAFPVPPDAEPAFVFRAAAARPGDLR